MRSSNSERADERRDNASLIEPHENDVLMGRGGRNNQHSGNQVLRNVARDHCETYRVSSKKVKSRISRHLVHYMRGLDPPTRFLRKNPVSGVWEDVGDNIAREKAVQALRDAEAAQEEAPIQNPVSGVWEDVGDNIAREKAAQALRDAEAAQEEAPIQNPVSGVWEDVGDNIAREKAAQALRDAKAAQEEAPLQFTVALPLLEMECPAILRRRFASTSEGVDGPSDRIRTTPIRSSNPAKRARHDDKEYRPSHSYQKRPVSHGCNGR